MRVIDLGEKVQNKSSTLAIIINDTDNIAYDTAEMLAEKVVELDKLDDIDTKYEHIIICGHGNHKRLTIGKIEVTDIADRIVDRGYGFQDIYITSCFSNKAHDKNSKTIVDALRERIRHITGEDAIVTSDADGATITYEERGRVKMLVIENKIQISFLANYEDRLKKKARRKGNENISLSDIEKIRKKMVKVATMGGLLVRY